MKPRVKKFEPVTKFDEAIAEECFESEYEAKVYIGKRLEDRGEGTYESYADVFDEMITTEEGRKKKYIDDLLSYIFNKAAEA